jgi:DNA replication protein DnaC
VTNKNLNGISFGYTNANGTAYKLQDPTKGISEIKAGCYNTYVAGMGPNMILPRGKDDYNRKLVSGFDFEGCKEKDICISDMLKFFQSAQEYSKLGVPHKRGIILYGPPGTGKSAIALAM